MVDADAVAEDFREFASAGGTESASSRACFSSLVQKLVESRSRAVSAQAFWVKCTR